jgi:lipoate-protein ligase A
VIGSGQAASDFDRDRLSSAGIDLVRRHSGGGAVLVAPGLQVWLDVFVPSGDLLWSPDIRTSFYWLGELYAAALASVVVSAAPSVIEVNRGPSRRTAWSKVLCYAGLGAGEVTVAGRKVVGMSQRRDHAGAWIHSMALLSDRPASLAEMLSGTAEHRSAGRAVLADTGLDDAERLVGPLTSEILGRLP